ncbi:hypothetical protein [Polluticoccus soli]|uniref:hypothetical protein n=1 Tax=Polluticoccus soli TaxID=3034150 RepID=UPI0023E25A19|nr:hypothetical protein [Flavipsychrobacter sp. JY13-12]
MKEIRTLLACALLSVAAVGCSKDEKKVSPATGSRSVYYEVNTEEGGAELVPGTTFAWLSGSGYADEIKFEAKSDDGSEITYKSKTDRAFDLFAPTASLLGNIMLPPGTYDKIKYKIRLEPSYPDAALRLDGQFTENGISVPVVFAINRDVEMKVEGKDVLLLDGDDYLSVLTLQLDKLMNGITPDMLFNADVDDDGTVYITENSNREMYHIMMDNMEHFIKVECRKKKK